MDHLHRNSHLLHDINAIFKREYNTFLSGTDNMMFAMRIKVQSTDATTDFFIIQHTFGTVTKGQDTDSRTTDRRFGSQYIHFIIRYSFGSNVAFYP